ncbi:MAG TPA: peptide chain release factor 1 [bacterium]|nr:peptide chain release factor 1 [bacterium]
MELTEKLNEIRAKYDELAEKLSQPDITSDIKSYHKYSKELSDLQEMVEAGKEYSKIMKDIEDNIELSRTADDKEMEELALNEIKILKTQKEEMELKIKKLLIPKDPLDEKNIIMEIRAGTGGDESSIFTSDLFRMYSRYAELNKWKIEIMSMSETGVGGYKEIIFMISGKMVYSKLKFESGTHRVQRVPVTEANGRVHTSAITVAVLPEADDIEIEIKQEDLKIDVYRSSGHGGQSVNTTDSAVRVTHLPTGLVITCQDEKSQLKNKAKAIKVLKSRLLDAEIQKQNSQISAQRKKMVGSGDRSERIRTYNFPQNRMTDHRINLTLYKLNSIIDGDLDELIDALITADELEKLISL